MSTDLAGAGLAGAPAAAAAPAPSRELPGWRRRLEAFLLSIAGAAILLFATRYPAAGPLVGAGWVVMMLPAVCDRWRAPVWGFLPGQLFFVAYANMPMRRLAWFVPYVLPTTLSAPYFVQALLAYWLRRATRWPAVVVLPLCVAAGEWLRQYVSLGGFNMYQTGLSLFEYPLLIQAADLVGSYGISLLWTIPWAALVDLGVWLASGRPAAERRTVRLALGAALAVLVALPLYGTLRGGEARLVAGPRVTAVQPALEHGRDKAAEILRLQSAQTAAAVTTGSTDLIAWPENALLKPYERDDTAKQVIRWLADTRGAPVLFGTQALSPEGRPTNTALIVDKDGTTRGRYDKIVLFPFSERRAFRRLEQTVPPLGRLLTKITLLGWDEAPDGWSPESVGLLSVPGHDDWRFWTPICYESCFPGLAREAVAGGARFFVNLTSEGWTGWASSNNMMGANVFRAVENRVGIVRVGNTGPSAFILPNGRVEEYLRSTGGKMRLQPGVLTRAVRLDPGSPTVYARIGGILDPLWFLLALGGVAWGLWRGPRAAHEVSAP